MSRATLKIDGVTHSKSNLADAALAELANNPADYGLDSVDLAQSAPADSRALDVTVTEGDACEAGQAALWKVLEKLMLERGIIWQKPGGGHTDANVNEESITADQISCS